MKNMFDREIRLNPDGSCVGSDAGRPHRPGALWGPNGPCEDLGQCGECIGMVGRLRPRGETFYDHAEGCTVELHWGPCEGATPARDTECTRLSAEEKAELIDVLRTWFGDLVLHENPEWRCFHAACGASA